MKAKDAANITITVLGRMSGTDRDALAEMLSRTFVSAESRKDGIRQIINRSVNQQVTVDKTTARIGDIIDQLKAARA